MDPDEPQDFNIVTVNDRGLVSRRKGLQVSKERHGSLAFVNTLSAPSGDSTRSRTHGAKRTAAPLRFVNNGVSDPIPWQPRVVAARPARPKNAAARQKAATAAATAKKAAAKEDEGEGEVAQPGTIFFKTTDSQWAFPDGYSAEFACQQLGIWNQLCRQMQILPVWSTHEAPLHLQKGKPRHLILGLESCPAMYYPLENTGVVAWNPMREAERYAWLPRSTAVLTQGLMMGALLESARTTGESSTFNILHKAVVGIVNGMITSNQADQPTKDLLVFAIALMALAANVRGENDTWRLHVTGLKGLIDDRVSAEKMHATVSSSSVRLADIEGAVAAGERPILPFRRMHRRLVWTLPIERVDHIQKVLMKQVSDVPLDVVIADALIRTCIYNETVRHARKFEIKFNPHELAEDFWELNHALISHALQVPDEETVMAETYCLGDVTFGGGIAAAQLADMKSEGSIQQKGCIEAFNNAVRIAVLLYLREPMAEVIFARRSYPKLLQQMNKPLGDILTWVREQKLQKVLSGLGSPGPGSASYPRLTLEAARPFLVWICLVGHLYAQRMSNYHTVYSGHSPHGSLYRQIVVALLDNGDGPVSDDDLVVCSVLDLRYCGSEQFDVRRALRNMLGESVSPGGVF